MSDRKPSARAKRVWQRFAEWYGARFAESYGPQPTPSWSEVIDRESDETLQAALQTTRRAYLHHPPSLPEFEAELEKARAPIAASASPDVRHQLVEFVLRRHHAGVAPLTPRQIGESWKWIVKWFDAPGPDGKMRKSQGCEYHGVVIAADGDHPGYRVMVEDMQLESAA